MKETIALNRDVLPPLASSRSPLQLAVAENPTGKAGSSLLNRIMEEPGERCPPGHFRPRQQEQVTTTLPFVTAAD